MFNIGFSELLIIGLVALIFLGPDQLPSAVRSLARVIRDLKRASSQIKEQIDPEIADAANELRSALHDPELSPQIRSSHHSLPRNKAQEPTPSPKEPGALSSPQEPQTPRAVANGSAPSSDVNGA